MKTKTLESPIQSLGSFFGNELLIKREDLLPFSFGGNKVRIAQKFFDDMESQNRNSIITYGGTHSNLARIVSNLASARKIPCYIISTYDGGDRSPSSNDALRRISGAKIVECEKKNIAETVETLLENLKNLGYSPYYTHGNSLGIGNESTATSAYAEVFDQFDLGGGGADFSTRRYRHDNRGIDRWKILKRQSSENHGDLCCERKIDNARANSESC